MSDPSVQELANELTSRLDDLLKEVRRQGRAAIAAQAAAESCLEALQAQPSASDETDGDEDDDELAPTADDEAARWLRALLPVADAVERVARQATALEAPRTSPQRGLLGRLLHTPEPDDGHAARVALAEGLRVLGAQLEGTLRDLGVRVDRHTGSPVDAERQRVVEVRSPRPGERPGTVVEVVRPGYSLNVRNGGERIIREAEVVIAAEKKKP
jgi:molecular chaperone GrpE (heat shock protein)